MGSKFLPNKGSKFDLEKMSIFQTGGVSFSAVKKRLLVTNLRTKA